MKYKIDQHVPIPGQKRRKALYPIWHMDVGESFLVPASGNENLIRKRLDVACWRHRQTDIGKTKEYVVRRVEGGYRCWRTK